MKIFRIVRNMVLVASVSFLFIACSSKQKDQEYNKPALYWYNKMLKEIASGYIENADDTFTSLESEHKNSPLISTSLLILANAHIVEEEYELANYYIDEYNKRYGLSKNIDYVRYMKIKANFLSIGYQFREQKLFSDTIAEIDVFIEKFPNSPYIHLIRDIKSRLLMGKASFDKEISELYGRIDKENASKLYLERSKKSWNNTDEIEEVKVPWYRSIFE